MTICETLAQQFRQVMEDKRLRWKDVALCRGTLARVLHGGDLRLSTLAKAADALGYRLHVELRPR